MDAKLMDPKQKWQLCDVEFDDGIGARASIGLIVLSTDRAGVWDLERFLSEVPDLAFFTTRVPMSPLVTPDTLSELADHLENAARLLVPSSNIDVIGFPCTTGTVQIGVRNVHAKIGAGRPGIRITTSIEAGTKALHKLGVKRLSVLTPYLPEAAELIGGYFEESGLAIDNRFTFGLDGDPEMNRVSAEAIYNAAISSIHPESDALFISCNGLRTASVIDKIEAKINRPVVTSNQALAWDCLRLAGVSQRISGRGRLLFEH